MTGEEIAAFLAENVTVVKPGETLVIRVSDLTPNQMREYQQAIDQALEWRQLPFQCLVVYAEELGVVQPGHIQMPAGPSA